MRKGLIFFLGIVTGCVLTIAVLFASASDSLETVVTNYNHLE